VVVPARYASTRLPGKPLLPLAGRPMIEWVYRRACRTGAHSVLIATDDERIAEAARACGAPVAMTDAAHGSGTDRIAEVARHCGWAMDEIVVNLQGDEPLMPEALVTQVAALLAASPSAGIATLAVPIGSSAELADPNVVKVVTDPHERALYFSRAPIPFVRDARHAGAAGEGSYASARRHLGLYAYRVEALLRLSELPPSPLERLERLEQLRALENGIEIRVAEACRAAGPDVNTAEDLARAEAALLKAGEA